MTITQFQAQHEVFVLSQECWIAINGGKRSEDEWWQHHLRCKKKTILNLEETHFARFCTNGFFSVDYFPTHWHSLFILNDSISLYSFFLWYFWRRWNNNNKQKNNLRPFSNVIMIVLLLHSQDCFLINIYISLDVFHSVTFLLSFFNTISFDSICLNRFLLKQTIVGKIIFSQKKNAFLISKSFSWAYYFEFKRWVREKMTKKTNHE